MLKKEKRWKYNLDLTFNGQKIKQIIITGHYLENHPEITNELILEILEEKLNGQRVRPDINYLGQRKVFVWDTDYSDKNYRLIFWFKDGTNSHLWIRNCYPIKE
jgi:hypothetical protein